MYHIITIKTKYIYTVKKLNSFNYITYKIVVL